MSEFIFAARDIMRGIGCDVMLALACTNGMIAYWTDSASDKHIVMLLTTGLTAMLLRLR